MKRRKAKAPRKRPEPRTTLTDAQGEALEARILFALAAVALENDEGPGDADLPRVRIATSEVVRVMWRALARLDRVIDQLDEATTALATKVTP